MKFLGSIISLAFGFIVWGLLYKIVSPTFWQIFLFFIVIAVIGIVVYLIYSVVSYLQNYKKTEIKK